MSLLPRAAFALCCMASVAHAHAPLPRGLAVAPNDSGAIAIRMPGFGWLLRSADSAPFAYACDALVGVSPLEERAPMAYRSDGTLLIGSANGLRMLSRAGCPAAETPLGGQPITALAAQPTDGGRVYAITELSDAPPAVQRSEDGGLHWTMAATLAAYPVSALVIDEADAQALYVGQTLATDRTLIAVSHDGGETFETFEQDRALTLLEVQSGPSRLWAVARVPNAPVGWAILRAEEARGPWQELLTVNFFGGLAIDPSDPDVIWVGDEARGVFRSNDGGDSFEETQPSVASACLAYGAGALWSCTPGTPTHPALARSRDALEPFDPIMAFADVDRLVECDAAVDVEEICRPAWTEWQRDVVGVALAPAASDAGTMDQQDAGKRSDTGAAGSGCSAVLAAEHAARSTWPWLAIVCWLARPRKDRG